MRYAAAASEAVAYAQIAIAAALHATPPVNGDTGSLLAGLDRIAVALEASIIDLHAIRVAVEKIAARDGDGSDKPPKPPKKP
ncbi:MAG: hypothetical protein Q8S13_09785 [Dehalococcoidia bacterium]|nr:hypothetical protein [Dehalococcoidia bacterium]